MRLGILIYSLGGGGAERVVSHLLPYFSERKIEVHLFLMHATAVYDIPESVQVHYIENSNPAESGVYKLIKIPLLAIRYAKLLKQLDITHSLSLLTRPNYINILSRKFTSKKFKLIISERGQPSLQYSYKGLQSTINKFLIRKLYAKADSIICNSMGNRDDLITNFGISKGKIEVLNNPIDLDKVDKIDPIADYFDSRYFNIITVGRLNKGKNHKLLIDAVENIDGIRLYILGEGELENELKTIIVERNLGKKIFFMGFDPPYKYLKAADLFIFGSNHEGFPNVLLEAMACGLPILSTNCKSGPDEILKLDVPLKDDIMITDYGILTPVNNKRLMIKGIEYFRTNTEYLLKTKKNSLERVRRFDKSSILRKYETCILATE